MTGTEQMIEEMAQPVWRYGLGLTVRQIRKLPELDPRERPGWAGTLRDIRELQEVPR